MNKYADENLNFEDEIPYALDATFGESAAVRREIGDQIITWIAYHVTSPEGGGSIGLVALGHLDDGRHVTATAWADYTGWGCQENCDLRLHDDLPSAIANGLTLEEARLLDVPKATP